MNETSTGQRIRVVVGITLVVVALVAPRLDLESLIRGSGIRFERGPITDPATAIGALLFLDVVLLSTYRIWLSRTRTRSTVIDESGIALMDGHSEWRARWSDLRHIRLTPLRGPSGMTLATVYGDGWSHRIVCDAERTERLKRLAANHRTPIRVARGSIRYVSADYIPGMALLAATIWGVLSAVSTFIWPGV